MSFKSFLASGHFFGRHHAGDAQIDLGEIVEADRLGQAARPAVRASSSNGTAASAAASASAGSALAATIASTFFAIDPLHHVLELADRRAQQRLLRLVPDDDRLAEQFARLLGQLAAAPGPGRWPTAGTGSGRVVQTSCSLLAALRRVSCSRVSQAGAARRYLLARSRRGHECSRIARLIIARLVGRGDFLSPSSAAWANSPLVVRILGRQAPSFRRTCRAAGQVHDLAHQVGVHLGDEIVEVQIEVVDAAMTASRRSSSAGRPGRDAPGTSPPG